ncbi:MAG TPA: hypothetical protein VHC43_03675 [Mycobacteriales bacterium]|nr:hypothetical protein [Mycobacteriales bacterium]
MTAIEGVEFSLPGVWWSLDLRDSDAAIKGRINAILDEAVGRADNRAGARHGVREGLLQVAAQGKAIKAHQVHIARSLVGEIPFAATLLISRPGVAVPELHSPQDTAAGMLTLIPGDDPTIIENPALAVVRSVERAASPSDPSLTTHVTINYWIALPQGARLVVFTFSSPLPMYEQELITLFDAIAMTTSVRENDQVG